MPWNFQSSFVFFPSLYILLFFTSSLHFFSLLLSLFLFSRQRLDLFSFLSVIYILLLLIYFLFLFPRLILSFRHHPPFFQFLQDMFLSWFVDKMETSSQDKKQAITTAEPSDSSFVPRQRARWFRTWPDPNRMERMEGQTIYTTLVAANGVFRITPQNLSFTRYENPWTGCCQLQFGQQRAKERNPGTPTFLSRWLEASIKILVSWSGLHWNGWTNELLGSCPSAHANCFSLWTLRGNAVRYPSGEESLPPEFSLRKDCLNVLRLSESVVSQLPAWT